jgi:hypothetical protein
MALATSTRMACCLARFGQLVESGLLYLRASNPDRLRRPP